MTIPRTNNNLFSAKNGTIFRISVGYVKTVSGYVSQTSAVTVCCSMTMKQIYMFYVYGTMKKIIVDLIEV